MSALITIDGSQGEGGGQILRTSLALAMLTQRPLRINRIRAARKRPGLQRQHLTAVQAAARICSAALHGAALDSTELLFEPQPVQTGVYEFDIGSAGSCSLVLQTVLPPLLALSGPSTVRIKGGTHNPLAPPYDFLQRAFLPLVNRHGPLVTGRIKRHGFFPRGGGQVEFTIAPADSGLSPVKLLERGKTTRRLATAIVAGLPRAIAQRELDTLAKELSLRPEELQIRELSGREGPGNAVLFEVESEQVCEVFANYGRRGVPAETVAAELAGEARRYLDSQAVVGEHLADQLLIPFALAGAGSMLTLPLSQHSQTNIQVIERFLPVSFDVSSQDDGLCVVEVRR